MRRLRGCTARAGDARDRVHHDEVTTSETSVDQRLRGEHRRGDVAPRNRPDLCARKLRAHVLGDPDNGRPEELGRGVVVSVPAPPGRLVCQAQVGTKIDHADTPSTEFSDDPTTVTVWECTEGEFSGDGTRIDGLDRPLGQVDTEARHELAQAAASALVGLERDGLEDGVPRQHPNELLANEAACAHHHDVHVESLCPLLHNHAHPARRIGAELSFLRSREAPVGPFVAYEQFWLRYVDFRGRSSRAEYWWVFLINLVLELLFTLGARSTSLVSDLGLLYGLAAIIPNLALVVRRLHDSDHRGWWIFIALVPIVGAIVLLVFELLPGTPGPNRYGDPSTPVRSPRF